MQAHIAVLSPQVELYRNQQQVLQMEQKRLNQKILNCSRNKLLRDGDVFNIYLYIICLNYWVIILNRKSIRNIFKYNNKKKFKLIDSLINSDKCLSVIDSNISLSLIDNDRLLFTILLHL